MQGSKVAKLPTQRGQELQSALQLQRYAAQTNSFSW
jgi:hypothetical protein